MDIDHIDSVLFLSLAGIAYFIARMILVIKQIRQLGQPQKFDVEKQPIEVVEGRKLATMDNIKVAHHRISELEDRLDKIEAEVKKERSDIVAEIITMRKESHTQFEALSRAIGRLEGARLAGKRGNVILDEFALHKDQQKLLKVSSAVTQWGGQRIVISTHRGKGSVFAQLVNDCVNNGNPMRWSHHRVTIQDAVDAGIVERINAKTGKKMTREDFLASCRAKCLTEADFLEEYMCVPQDTAGQLVSWDTINACTNDRYATAAGNIAAEEGEFGVGVDVARLSDKHCYIALKPWHDRYVVRLVYYHEDNSWESRDRKLDEMTGAAGVKLVVIDQTGLGDKYVEDAKKRRNGHKVRGILFTNGSKEELASNLARALEAGKIIIPSHDLLKAHIAAIEKGYTKTGLVCYSADRTESGHADLFWALAMAYHALTLKASDGVWTRERAEGVVMGSSRGRYRHQRRILTRTRK